MFLEIKGVHSNCNLEIKGIHSNCNPIYFQNKWDIKEFPSKFSMKTISCRGQLQENHGNWFKKSIAFSEKKTYQFT